ncbi:PspC domain-containing protein [Luteimicrobium subarcticum]|nr:PspC domain-containing protein [Luteimicrobium subarcticum]
MNDPHGASDRTTGAPPETPRPDAARGDTPPGTGSTDAFFASIERAGLRRSDDRWVAGVAGGVARRYGIDPVLVRGIWLVACLVAGVGLVVYALAWAFLPDDREGTSLVQDAVHGRFRAGLVGAIIAFLVGINGNWWGWSHVPTFFSVVFWLGALGATAVLVVALVGSSRRQQGGAPRPQGAPGWTAPAPALSAPPPAATAPYPTTGAPAPRDTWPPAATKTPVTPRPRRRGGVQGIVLGLVLVAGAVVLTADHRGSVTSPWLVWGGAAMVLLGLGIAVAGVLDRRSGWLTTIAIVLGVTLLPAAALDRSGAFDGDVRSIAPSDPVVVSDVTTAEQGYTYSVGDLTLDLSELPLPATGDGPVTVPVRLGAGNTVIELPPGAEVQADVDLWAGDVTWDVGGDHQAQTGVHSGDQHYQTSGVAAGGTPQIRLDVTVAAGQITIEEK